MPNKFVPNLLLAFCLIIIYIAPVSAQIAVTKNGKQLTGKVITSDNIPVSYATVKIVENKKSTITDEDGNFYFNKLDKNIYHLFISGIGFENISKEVNLENDIPLTIQISLSENQLKEVIVKTQLKSYTANESYSATRANIPLKDIPQSIQVITSQILKDRQAVNLNDAAKSIGAISQNGSNETTVYNMRGFAATDGNYAYDGIRYNDFRLVQLQDPFYNIDHVEYIKGPASAIYGQGAPGGVINMVTKKPLPFKRYEFDVTTGSYNQYRFMTDFTGALSKNKKFLYRFVAGYENINGLNRNQHIQNISIAPQIEFNPSAKTSIRLSTQYYYDDRIVYGGIGVPAFFDTVNQKFIPDYYSARTSLNSPLGQVHADKLLNEISFTHTFSDKIKFTSLLLFLNFKHTITTTDFNGDDSYLVTSDSIPVTNAIEKIKHFNFQSSSFAEFKFNTGALKNILVSGIDFSFLKESYVEAQIETRNVFIPNPDLSWGIYNFNDAYKNLDNYDNSFAYKVEDIRAGVYVNDLISFTDKWKLLAGARFDYFRGTPHPYFPAYSSLFKDTAKTNTFYPRVGLVWEPLKNISFYASYTRGFFPQSFSDKGSGGPFPPEKSAQYELGTKIELMQSNLLITAATYSIQKYNVVVDDTIPNKSILLKHLYSKGFEFSIQGKPAKYISVVANYAYNITKVASDELVFIQSNQFPEVPKNGANAWLNYELKKTGFSAGAGFNYLSKRSTFTNGFFVPAYTTVDAGISYTIKKLRLACNLYNITNKRYWTGGSSSVNLYPGNPFSFRLNFNYVIE